LLAALREAEARADSLKARMLELQAVNVLNEMYCEVIRRQLAYQEGKSQRGKENWLVMDCLVYCQATRRWWNPLSGRNGRNERKQLESKPEKIGQSCQLAEWKKGEEVRKQENDKERRQYREADDVWEVAKARAKVKKRKFGQLKPKTQKLEGPIPKPPLILHDNNSSDDQADTDEDNASD
jgi:hypothetical protein